MVYNKIQIEVFINYCFLMYCRQVYEVREDEEDG